MVHVKDPSERRHPGENDMEKWGEAQGKIVERRLYSLEEVNLGIKVFEK